MSRSAIRAQVIKYLGEARIKDLNQIFPSFPNRIDFQVNAKAGQMSRCAAVVFFENEMEMRLALGGDTNGLKRVNYRMVVQLFHHSLYNDSLQAMEDFDETIDQLKSWLRADHRFGDPNGEIIWQAAEDAIDIDYGEPAKSNGGATETWAAVRFIVTEMLHA